MVVPVLMTSCQVSDQRNSGPVIAQTRTVPAAMPKPQLLPAQCVTAAATRSTIALQADPVAPFFSLRLISAPEAESYAADSAACCTLSRVAYT